MGYYANLYFFRADADDKGVKTTLNIYGSELGRTAYFCWGPGVRQPKSKLFDYADGSVVCDTELRLLPGYPETESYPDPNQLLVEADFRPSSHSDAVLFHFMLPKGFIPRGDLQPLQQPIYPFVFIKDERLFVTYPVDGPRSIRFWITRLGENERLADFETHKLLHPEEVRASKVEYEFNLGFFKLKKAIG